MIWLLIIPIAFAFARLFTRKYVFSALTTLACAAIAAPHAPILAAGLVISAVGDYFMSHRGNRDDVYVLAIACFFIGHALFIADAVRRVTTIAVPLVLGAALLVGYSIYLFVRLMPKLSKAMKIAVSCYMLISAAGITCAMMTADPVYIASIALLLFSDTMIAESDFVENKKARLLILPPYYLCHILMALSAMLR